MTLRRFGLGLTFVAWLYGVPFLILTAAVRWIVNHGVAGAAFGSQTVRLLLIAMGVDIVLPVAGAVAASFLRDVFWWQHFKAALGGAIAYFVVLLGLLGVTGPSPAGPHEPAPEVSHCVQYSGAPANCPGG